MYFLTVLLRHSFWLRSSALSKYFHLFLHILFKTRDDHLEFLVTEAREREGAKIRYLIESSNWFYWRNEDGDVSTVFQCNWNGLRDEKKQGKLIIAMWVQSGAQGVCASMVALFSRDVSLNQWFPFVFKLYLRNRIRWKMTPDCQCREL